ncbi:MAG: hypothetical protein WCE79_02865 [Xanthobacteraceae bacterium]
MLKFWRTYSAHIVWGIAALFFVLGLLTLHPIYADICAKDAQTGAENCTRNHILLYAIKRIGEFSHDYHGILTALATIAIAWFTWTLRRSTDKLYEAGERQIAVARDSAEAAIEANKLTRASLISDQRPWVVIDLATTGEAGTSKKFGVLAIDDKRIIVGFTLTLNNTGKTPAQNISVSTELRFLSSGIENHQQRICREALQRRIRNGGFTVFPSKPFPVMFDARVNVSEMTLATLQHAGRKYVTPVIIGAITYDHPPDNLDRQLSFMYIVEKIGDPLGIAPAPGLIEGERLRLMPMPLAGTAT